MEDELIKLLESFGYPVRRQGSFADDEEYPETFFTFWNNDEYELKAYDNATFSVVFDFDVNIYGKNSKLVYDLQLQARQLLKSNGFQTQSRGYDVASDEKTHIGRGMRVIKEQKIRR